MKSILESEISVVSTHSRVEGKVVFDRLARIHGTIKGDIEGQGGSEIFLMETSVIEGNIVGDSLTVEGYVKGNIRARTQVVVAQNGRVFGDIRAPIVKIASGAIFEGRCLMEDERRPSPSQQLSPA